MRIYRVMVNILLLVLSFKKQIPDSDLIFVITSHSPDKRGSTPIEIVTHGGREYCIHACSGGEGCKDNGLHESLSVRSSFSSTKSILTLISTRFTKLLSPYAIETVTMSGNGGFGNRTGKSHSRNPTAGRSR